MVTKGEKFPAKFLSVQACMPVATAGEIIIAGLRGGEVTDSQTHI